MGENKKDLDIFEMLEMEDAGMSDAIQAWRKGVYARQGLPRPMKELLMLAMCCVVNHEVGIPSHMKRAYDAGASREAILDTILQTTIIGGMPAYRRGATAYRNMFYGDNAE